MCGNYTEFHFRVLKKDVNSIKRLVFMEKHRGKGREHGIILGVQDDEHLLNGTDKIMLKDSCRL